MASPAANPQFTFQTTFSRRRGFQRSFFCSCGRPLDARLSRCRTCAWEVPYSRRYFGGQRASVLERDGRRCQSCGSPQVLHVHHRRPGVHEREWLVTLCAGCHARVHRLQALRFWLPKRQFEFEAPRHE
jgi:5-methylcytosine-specific restriction endonuclease McrA